MSEALHPSAAHSVPAFIVPPGGADVLMVLMAGFLALAVLAFGILFFRLHALPEQIAHRGHKIQFEIVAVLGLISLFTHMHIFWIAGLLLALVELPDFSGLLGRIAGSVETMAGAKRLQGAAELPSAAISEARRNPPPELATEATGYSRGDRTTLQAAAPEIAPAINRELSDA